MICLGALLGIGSLHLYDSKKINPEDFALRREDMRAHESWNGKQITAASVPEMQHVLKGIGGGPEDFVLWLGNSQLHTINQPRPYDHLAPYWLKAAGGLPEGTIPLGFSLPNANLQEYFGIAAAVLGKVPVRALVLGLVFDDLREDDLRSDFASFLTQPDRMALSRRQIGGDMLARLAAPPSDEGGQSDDAGLKGFAQKYLEDRLNGWLGAAWPLWAERPNLRARALTDLFLFRNYVLGIRATTVRRMIPIRYERNMGALRAILQAASEKGVPVITYIVPLRPDVPAPYDVAQYSSWKAEMARLAAEDGVRHLNLEGLVPGSDWGWYAEGEVDFMHFGGAGHVRLAEAIGSHVRELVSQR